MTYAELASQVSNGKVFNESQARLVELVRKAILHNRIIAKDLTDEQEIIDQTSDQNNFATMVRMGKEANHEFTGVAYNRYLKRQHYLLPDDLSEELIQELKDHKLKVSIKSKMDRKEKNDARANEIIRSWGGQRITKKGITYTKTERIYLYKNEFYSTRGGHWKKVDFYKLFIDLYANGENSGAGGIEEFIEDIFDINPKFNDDVNDHFKARKIVNETNAKRNKIAKVANLIKKTIEEMESIGMDVKSLKNQHATAISKSEAISKPIFTDVLLDIKKKRNALKSPKNEVKTDIVDDISQEVNITRKLGKSPRSKRRKQNKQSETDLIGFMIDQGFSVKTYGGEKITKDKSGNIVSVPMEEVEQKLVADYY